MTKELISSLKLLVSDGKFLSFPVFQPSRGLRDEAAFIGQISFYHIHQLALPFQSLQLHPEIHQPTAAVILLWLITINQVGFINH